MKSHRFERLVIIATELFVGVMAMVGTVGLLGGFWSEGLPVAMLEGSPFTSYLIPALTLLLFVGGSSFLAVLFVVGHHPLGDYATLMSGGILIVFEIVEYLVIGLTMFLQPVMLAVGVGLIVLASLRLTMEHAA
jgi:hypothetical protein